MKHATILGKWALFTSMGVIVLGCSDGTDLPRCADGDQLTWSDSDGAWACESTESTSDDWDGDGLTNAEEEALGTDPQVSDSDGDALEDGVEVALGTDPLLADTDGDGLEDGFEQVFGSNPLVTDTDADGLEDAGEYQHGTDPRMPDTDGDTFSDGIEVGQGPALLSDPLHRFDWPLGLGWPDHRDAATQANLIGEGWDVEQTAPNFTLNDQFGNALELYQFYGYIINITVSTSWCPASLYDAKTAVASWNAVRKRGVIFMDVYFDDGFWKAYADRNGLTFPVLNDDEDRTVVSGAGITAIPGVIIIGRDMKVQFFGEGAGISSGVIDAMLADEVCGNGIVEPGEACDDGNVEATDGCSPTCQIETCRLANNFGTFTAGGWVSGSPEAIGAIYLPDPGKALLGFDIYDGRGVFSNGFTPGSYTLAGAEFDEATCGLCLNIWDDFPSLHQPRPLIYRPTGGTVHVTATNPVALEFEDLTFQAIDDSACTTTIEHTGITGNP